MNHEEKTFFDDGLVRVTNARFIVNNQTFIISNITSVASQTNPANRTIPLFLILLGIPLIYVSGIGILLIISGLLRAYSAKPVHHVVLRTSSGESKAISNDQIAYVRSIVDAINEAIVYRG